MVLYKALAFSVYFALRHALVQLGVTAVQKVVLYEALALSVYFALRHALVQLNFS